MEPHTFENLGAAERPKDERDHPLGSATPSSHPPVFMQSSAWNAPIFYQGKRPACGAHAGAWAKMLLNINDGKTSYPTPRFTWIDIKKDSTSPSDGADMRSIFASLKNTGIAPFEPLENNVSLDDADYASGSTAPTGDVIASYAFDDGAAFDALKQYIFDHKAVILLLRVGQEMWTTPSGMTSWQEKDVLPMRPPQSVVSGHFVVAHSYDEQYIYFANSWSTSWGRAGHGYFGQDYMPFVVEIGAAQNPPTDNQVVAQVVTQSAQALKTIQTLPPAQQKTFLARLQAILETLSKLVK